MGLTEEMSLQSTCLTIWMNLLFDLAESFQHTGESCSLIQQAVSISPMPFNELVK